MYVANGTSKTTVSEPRLADIVLIYGINVSQESLEPRIFETLKET
jgi:hypothetical protein